MTLRPGATACAAHAASLAARRARHAAGCAAVGSGLLLAAPVASAGALTDGSTGAVQSLSGQFTVPQNLGTVRGANLFHSFTRFGIATGESATFSTSDAGIRHVIGRVTGGEASTLQGPLRLQAAAGARPDFWLVNPNGITVGAGASFDVPAGLHLSTAQQLRFADGLAWDSRGGVPSTLSVAAPESFGFLGLQLAAPLSFNDTRTVLQTDGRLTLSAGDVTLQAATLELDRATLRVAAVGGARATVPVAGEMPAAGGTVRIERSRLSTTGAGGIALGAGAIDVVTSRLQSVNLSPDAGGAVALNATQALTLDTSLITSETQAGGAAGDLRIRAGGNLTARNAGVISRTSAAGASGSVSVDAGRFDLDGTQGATTATAFGTQAVAGTGAAGPVTVSVSGPMTITDHGDIRSSTQTAAAAGDIRVIAQSLTIVGNTDNSPGVGSQTVAGSSGSAGSVTLELADRLRLANGAVVSSSTFGSGSSGAIRITAGSIELDGGASRRAEIRSSSAPSSTNGSAGPVSIVLTQGLKIVGGGRITSGTFGSGAAGDIHVTARNVEIDGQHGSGLTGISSTNAAGSSGQGGSVTVRASESLRIANAGAIFSGTSGDGAAGTVRVSAQTIDIDGGDGARPAGISGDASGGSTGAGGNIDVVASERIGIVGNGLISSSTFGSGAAGTIRVSARSIAIDGKNGTGFTGILGRAEAGSSGNGGSIVVEASERIGISRSASISANTLGQGTAGVIQVSARTIDLDGGGTGVFTGITSTSTAGSTGDGGSVTVLSREALRIAGGASIFSGTFGSGSAGQILVTSPTIDIDGGAGAVATGIVGSANRGSSGASGSIVVEASERISLARRGVISASTFGSGAAGDIRITARAIDIDGDLVGGLTGITSSSEVGSSGRAGSVTVTATEGLRIVDAGSIFSGTFGTGAAGNMRIAARSIDIDGGGATAFTGISGATASGSSGQGGSLLVEASERIGIIRLGAISANTAGSGNAGNIRAEASTIDIDGRGEAGFTGIASKALAGSSGNSGAITVVARGQLRVADRSEVSSSSFGSGNAGSIHVTARAMDIDGRGREAFTGVSSQANPGSSGNAGAIRLSVAEALTIVDNATVTSATWAGGAAGSVTVNAGTLAIRGLGRNAPPTGILGRAYSGSSGQSGSLSIDVAGELALRNGGGLSIASDAQVSDPSRQVPTTLTVRAAAVTLVDSSISAAASGNVNASRMDVSASGRVQLERSAITTTANQGDGGSISVKGGSLVQLHNSSISTSVLGTRGNGGDIDIVTPALVLASGFIQANTKATRARGGDVNIDTRTLLPDGSQVLIGGGRAETPRAGVAGFNVIQAAAPDGVSGTLNVSLPQLNLAGMLTALSTSRLDLGLLSQDVCYIGTESSFTRLGRGGATPSATPPLRLQP